MSIAPEKHIRVMKMPKGTDSHRWIFLKNFIMTVYFAGSI